MTSRAVTILVAMLATIAVPASAQELSNEAFQIQYDQSGIRSLRRANDVHDTDYITQNGRLGPLLVRYRTTRHGDWTELRQILMTTDQQAQKGRAITYTLGVLEPSLASRASGSAQTGAGGIRGLNDGIVPAPPGEDAASVQGQVPRRMCRCSRGRGLAGRRSGCNTCFRPTRKLAAPRCSGCGRRSRGG